MLEAERQNAIMAAWSLSGNGDLWLKCRQDSWLLQLHRGWIAHSAVIRSSDDATHRRTQHCHHRTNSADRLYTECRRKQVHAISMATVLLYALAMLKTIRHHMETSNVTCLAAKANK